MAACSSYRQIAATAVAVIALTAGYALAGVTPEQKCTSAKLKAIGKLESGLLACRSAVAASANNSGLAACQSKARAIFAAGFAKAGSCVGDQATCDSITADCDSSAAAAMTDTFPSKCEAAKLKAAGKLARGQLGCYTKAARTGAALDSLCISKAASKFSAAIAKAGACPDGISPQGVIENHCVTPATETDGANVVIDICPTTTTTTTTTLPPGACADLVETDVLANWSSYGTNNPNTTLSLLSPAVAGETALRAVTDAPFEWVLRYDVPGAPIDASAADQIRFAIRGNNVTPYGWQGEFPVVVLEDSTATRATYRPLSQHLNIDGVNWVRIEIPLDGDAQWQVINPGVNLSDIVAVEVQADTWDAGFTIDLDAMSFEVAASTCPNSCPGGCSGHGTCNPANFNCQCALGWAGDLCDTCAADFVSSGGDCLPPNDASFSVWPNASSSVNGDAWLRYHHAQITDLEPRVLVLNFVNPSNAASVDTLIADVLAGFAEGSRPRGYADAGATVHLQYQLAKPIIDLRNGYAGNPAAPPGWPYENSTLMPREDPVDGAWGFNYAELFSSAFAPYYGYEVPSAPGTYYGLCELIESGQIHELWVVGSGDVPDVSAAEVLESKRRYTATGNLIAGSFDRCAGNGCFDADVPDCARSVRIGFVNYNRGPGCYLHSQSHGIESAGRGDALPALAEWFAPFAGFDLDSRYGLPFGSLYGLACSGLGCASYPTTSSATFYHDATPYDVNPYEPACGNVHFPPNARGHYDDVNTTQVLSTCEGFGTHSGAGGVDATTLVDADTWSIYSSLAPDCGGAFLVWWFQNMPSPGSGQTFADGRTMPGIWPFLFY